jgi:hypothetical protein
MKYDYDCFQTLLSMCVPVRYYAEGERERGRRANAEVGRRRLNTHCLN